jgi:peptidyl-prolyl cis-trans isomerase D
VGWLAIIEDYYRTEIPRRKLLEQFVADVYVTDEEMWNRWRETHDSAQASFVAITPGSIADTSAVSVSEAEIRSYYAEHGEMFEQPGRAQVSLIHLPKIISGNDSAAARSRIASLREEIVSGGDSSFAEVARRESDDLRSNMQGGELPRGVKGAFFGPAFDSAAFSLRAGQLSQPVLTPFGYHIIRLEEKQGDTVRLRHVLTEIRQNDSAAVSLDRRADSLASITGSRADRAAFDQAAAALGVPVTTALVFSGQPARRSHARWRPVRRACVWRRSGRWHHAGAI